MAPTTNRPIARAVLRSQSDARLVRLAREGGELAFEEIVHRYRPGLVAFAGAYTSAADAEDVVQESLVSSWSALQKSSKEIAVKPWLYTIVRNRALNARRDTKPSERLDENIDGVRQPSEVVLANDELARVVIAVNALPEAQREALVCSALEGHTHEQIAEALETSPGAVRQLIYRARANVRYGFGALLPLPLVSAFAGTGAGAPVVAATAGTMGTVGAGSMLAKGVAVVAVSAAAIGGGIALEKSGGNDQRNTGAEREPDANGTGERQSGTDSSDPGRGSDAAGSSSSSADGGSSGASGPGSEGQSDDDSEGSEDAAEGGEQREEQAEDARDEAEDTLDEARDEADDAREDAEDSDSSGSSGSGSSGSGSDSRGSGSSGSGSSGSGSGEPEPDEPEPPPPDELSSSGPGSGSSGSGSDSDDSP